MKNEVKHERFLMWLIAQAERFVVALLILFGCYSIFIKLLSDGIAETNITKTAIGGILTGVLIPITIQVSTFYLRTSSNIEKTIEAQVGVETEQPGPAPVAPKPPAEVKP